MSYVAPADPDGLGWNDTPLLRMTTRFADFGLTPEAIETSFRWFARQSWGRLARSRYNMCMIVHMSASLHAIDRADDCDEACLHPPAVFAARAAMGALPPVPDVARLFSLLADPTRLRLLSALAAGELCVCDLAIATGINRSTVSHQLRTLREGSLVRARREGRVVYYALDDDHVRDLLAIGAAHASEASASKGLS